MRIRSHLSWREGEGGQIEKKLKFLHPLSWLGRRVYKVNILKAWLTWVRPLWLIGLMINFSDILEPISICSNRHIACCCRFIISVKKIWPNFYVFIAEKIHFKGTVSQDRMVRISFRLVKECLFVSVVSVNFRNTETNRKSQFFGFHETNRKTTETDWVSVYFGLNRKYFLFATRTP